jgi:hypothetical protein
MKFFDKLKNAWNYLKPVSESIDDEEPGYTKLGDVEDKNITLDYLKKIRHEAWKAVLTNPLAKRQIRNVTSYLVGRGLKISSPSIDAQEIIDDFIHDPENYWELFVREESNRLQIDGEIIVLLFINTGNGKVMVRDIEPSEITEVILSPDDYRKILALRRVHTRKIYSDDFKSFKTETIDEYIKPGEPDPNNENIIRDFLFIKMPIIATQFRGIPELSSHLYWLKKYRQLLDARVVLNEGRAAFLWDVTVDGTDKDVKDVREKNSKPPRPGTVKFHNKQVTWEPKSLNINAQESEADLRAVKLMAVAGSGQPEYMITGDASNANFASTQETTFSFLKCLEDYQDLYEYFLGDLFNKVFYYAQKYGEAPETFKDVNGEEIKGDELINITFPETKPRDLEKLGKYLQILQLMGIVSDETLAGMAGIDWKAEKAKLEKEALERYPKLEEE